MRHRVPLVAVLMAVGWGGRAAAGELLLDLYGDPLPPGAVARLGTVRLWHPPRVRALRYSPDGRLLATGGEDGFVRLWDASTGKQRLALNAEGPIADLAFAPDGKTIAAVTWERGHDGDEHSIRIWDTTNATQLRRISLDRYGALCIAFSPDGGLLASAGHRVNGSSRGWLDTVHLWDPATGRRKLSLEKPGPGVYSIAFSPDGKSLVTGGVYTSDDVTGSAVQGIRIECMVRVWDLDASAECRANRLSFRTRNFRYARARVLPTDPVGCLLEYHPDGSAIAVGLHGATAVLVDPATLRETMILRLSSRPEAIAIAFSPRGAMLAANGDAGLWWEHESGRQPFEFVDAHLPPVRLAISPDGKTIAACYESGAIRLWDAATGEQRVPGAGHPEPVAALAFSPEDDFLVSSSETGDLRFWDTQSMRQLRRIPAESSSTAPPFVALTPDTKMLLALRSREQVDVISPRTGGFLVPFTTDITSISAAALSIDGSTLALAGTETPELTSRVALIDVSRKAGDLLLPLDTNPVVSIALSPDASELALLQHTWDLDDPKLVRRFEALGGRDRAPFERESLAEWFSPNKRYKRHLGDRLVYSQDGTTIAASFASASGLLILWDAESGRALNVLSAPGDGVRPIAFSPDGTLVAAGMGNDVGIWNVETGEKVSTLAGHESAVTYLQFSAKTRVLASGSRDGTALLWSVDDAVADRASE